jgi:hypothetical protein
MWEPRPLTTLWAFTACYTNSFTFFLPLVNNEVSEEAEESPLLEAVKGKRLAETVTD